MQDYTVYMTIMVILTSNSEEKQTSSNSFRKVYLKNITNEHKSQTRLW